MKLRSFPVPIFKNVDPAALDWPSEARAAEEDGLLENHDYLDLRGYSLADLEDILGTEQVVFKDIEQFSGQAENLVHWLEETSQDYQENCFIPVEFGVGSSVVALSWLGCVPITSCRGSSLGDSHEYEEAMVVFHTPAHRVHDLLEICSGTGVGIRNVAGGMVQIYSGFLPNLHRWAQTVFERSNVLQRSPAPR